MSSPAFSDSFKPEKVEVLYGPWNRVSYNTIQGGKGMIVSLSSAGALVLGALLFFFYRFRSSESRKKLEEMKSTNENEVGTLNRGDENEGYLSLYGISQFPEEDPISLSILADSHVIESIMPDEVSSSSSISTANQNAEVSGLFFDKEGNDLDQTPFSQTRIHPHKDATDDIEAQTPSSKTKIARAA
jgi:hypothetical protein